MFGFEGPIAQYQKAKTHIEEELCFDGHGCMAQCHQECSQQHRPPVAYELIGQKTTKDRCQIYQSGVDAIKLQRILALPSPTAFRKATDQEKHQQRPHTIVAETFPHFGEEEDEQPGRVSHQLRLLR
jgi:hypothetical protein